jgi:hypothetical protein
MTKTYGAFIRCVICGKEPFADDPALECHELRRFAPNGEFSDSPALGDWYCPAHAPAKSKRAARVVVGSPLEAVDAFESLLTDETARLAEALPCEDDDNTDDVEAAFETFGRETKRGLSQLKEVIAPHVKAVAKDRSVGSRRQRKAMTARARKLVGQMDLIEEELKPIRATS